MSATRQTLTLEDIAAAAEAIRALRPPPLIRERGYLEFKDDGLTKRINVPVMPATLCAAYQCGNIVVGRAVYCFDHVQAKRREEAA
jgi:hypothetical protein